MKKKSYTIPEIIDRTYKEGYKQGREDAVAYIEKELDIRPDFSPHADYVIPKRVLDAARSQDEMA